MQRDLPIVFCAPLIRANLAGIKTMMRRVLKPQPEQFGTKEGLAPVVVFQVESDPRPRIAIGRVITRRQVPYAVGDRLWIKEAWQVGMSDDAPCVSYKADHDRYYPDWNGKDEFPYDDYPAKAWSYGGWIPDVERDGPYNSGRFMPRWASRMTAVVTATKIERLQDITEADAIAEGVREPSLRELGGDLRQAAWSERQVFSRLWNHLHGNGAWDVNPFVLAIIYELRKHNIDRAREAVAA